MTEQPIDPIDAVQLLRTVVAHRDYLRLGLQKITHELERRALAHDLSKLSPDEFAGFSRINRAAREHPYGSEEYRASLQQEKPTVDLHYSRNDHHPETGTSCVNVDMGFLQIIEMVCDWYAAWKTYGSQGTWLDNLKIQQCRYETVFTDAQWWLIREVSLFVQNLGE